MRTHIRVTDNTVADKGKGFVLNPLHRQSANFTVSDVPVSLVVWELAAGESVEIRRARVDTLGLSAWRKGEGCCSEALEPDDNGNISHMPYLRCGRPVVLTVEQPQVTVDDVGIFYCVFHGDGEVAVERLNDVLRRKCCC